MTERSVLRVRTRPHSNPERADETIIEIVRDGQIVGFIYGSREGVHVASSRLEEDSNNTPFFFQAGGMLPGYVIPLLSITEVCPWCEDRGLIELEPGKLRSCPVCVYGERMRL